MANLTLALDSGLLRRSRAYAKQQGLSLNALVRNDLRKQTSHPENWTRNLFVAMDDLHVKSDVAVWTREELYYRA
jgi:hypothetical protein